MQPAGGSHGGQTILPTTQHGSNTWNLAHLFEGVDARSEAFFEAVRAIAHEFDLGVWRLHEWQAESFVYLLREDMQ